MSTSLLPAIEARDLAAGYGDLAVLRNFNLTVQPGEVVALIGPNGAGKTTLLRTLAGVQHPLAGEVLMGGELAPSSLHRRSRKGLSYVAESRSIIRALSVRDNLRLGGVESSDVVTLFPALGELMSRLAGSLSGGEQQMLTIGRALSRRTSILLVDELSLGLAPMIADRLGDAVRTATETGAGALIVEQDLRRALEMSDRYCLLVQGKVVKEGVSSLDDETVQSITHHYFGTAPTAEVATALT